jgi:hypothetical protein
MLKLAELTGLVPQWGRLPWFPFLKRVRALSGTVRGKSVEVFTTRSARMPTNLVARVKLPWENDSCISATRKRFGASLLRIIGRRIVASGDIILDRKITFQANDSDFAGKIFAYEEVREKFDTLFSHRLGTGTLAIGESSIFYRESSGILTRKKCQRFAIAIDLLCDLFDILDLYRRDIL